MLECSPRQDATHSHFDEEPTRASLPQHMTRCSLEAEMLGSALEPRDMCHTVRQIGGMCDRLEACVAHMPRRHMFGAETAYDEEATRASLHRLLIMCFVWSCMFASSTLPHHVCLVIVASSCVRCM